MSSVSVVTHQCQCQWNCDADEQGAKAQYNFLLLAHKGAKGEKRQEETTQITLLTLNLTKASDFTLDIELFPPLWGCGMRKLNWAYHHELHLDHLESFKSSGILCISSCCSQMFVNPSLQVAAARQQPSSYSPPASSVTPAGETQPDCFVPLLSFE